MESSSACSKCFESQTVCECTIKSNKNCIEKALYDINAIENVINNHINLISSSPPRKHSEFPPINIYSLFMLSINEISSNFPSELYTQAKNTLKILDLSLHKENTKTTGCTSTLCSSICCSKDFIFIIGGLSQFTAIDDIQCLNKETFQFERGLHLDHPRYFAASLVANDKLFVIGGIESNGEENGSNSVEIFDLKSFQKMKSLHLNHGFTRPGVTLIGNEIHVAGKEVSGFGYKINVIDYQINRVNFEWFQDEVYFVSSFNEELLLVGEKMIGTQKKQQKIKVQFSNSWSQQGAFNINCELYWYDYFTSQLVRVNLGFLN